MGAVLGLDLTGMITAAGRLLTSDESMRLDDFARRRCAGEPVARILGCKEFWGLPLQLSAATLVPRPDTETVVELALEMLRAITRPGHRFRIADIGTGSLYFLARSLEATGSDVSHAEGDYGTRFLATAGVLNLLAVLHAYEAARRRKA